MDFLNANDKMASLLPTVARMAALQKDCAAILPGIFTACEVLQFESDKLVLSVPSAALAAKLKQTLPRLRESLLKRGWQVSAIRLKVQVDQVVVKAKPEKRATLSGSALVALEELEKSLEAKPYNAPLRAALQAMVQRHRARQQE
ncbi:MAG: DciA family protein [Lacisediminimonas sp.]|nr:DciA family protein [Lacisediminimonas sp.]